ncbi:MAG: DUF4176 domain-containing protein [Lachnospiraceae bacterium]|nr:DUF4176 domain-containing protein [Lachnospiraceae bacterium]
MRELLPIGSVVLLKEATKKAMIYGVKQEDKSDGVEYDYLGVVYPEGNMGDGTQFFFNHDMIDQVFFRGFENEERAAFIDRLEEYYNQK